MIHLADKLRRVHLIFFSVFLLLLGDDIALLIMVIKLNVVNSRLVFLSSNSESIALELSFFDLGLFLLLVRIFHAFSLGVLFLVVFLVDVDLVVDIHFGGGLFGMLLKVIGRVFLVELSLVEEMSWLETND